MQSNAESFLALVLKDADLRARVTPLAVKKDLSAISAIAAEKGLPCTADELTKAYMDGSLPAAEDETLSDEHLAQVAGGKDSGYKATRKGGGPHLK